MDDAPTTDHEAIMVSEAKTGSGPAADAGATADADRTTDAESIALFDSERLRAWTGLFAAHKADSHALAAERAIELTSRDPLCGPAWRILGASLIALGRYPEASAAIHRALALYPSDLLWIPLCEMGHLHAEGGAFGVAASWYRRALDAAPDDAGPRIYLGDILARSGRPCEAEDVLRAATRCVTGSREEAYLNLGLVLRGLDRLDEAAEALAKAIEIDPGYEDAKAVLGDVVAAMKLRREGDGA